MARGGAESAAPRMPIWTRWPIWRGRVRPAWGGGLLTLGAARYWLQRLSRRPPGNRSPWKSLRSCWALVERRCRDYSDDREWDSFAEEKWRL